MPVPSAFRPPGPAPRRDRTDVPSPGTRVRARSWHPRAGGSGRPVVLLHGAGPSGRTLVPLGRRLAELGHEVLAPDLPGSGRTPRDPGLRRPGGADVAARAAHLLAWLDARGVERASLCGLSTGSHVAVELAARHPDRVDRLALLGPASGPRHGPPWRRYLRMLGDQVLEVPTLLPVLVAEHLTTGGARTVHRPLPGAEEQVGQRLPDVPVPALVVRGRHDRRLSQEEAEQVTRSFPDGRLVVIEGAAHVAHWSAPDVSARLVAAFLAGELDGPGVPGDDVVVPRSEPGDPLAVRRPLAPRAHAALDVVTTLGLLVVPWTRPWGPRTRATLVAAGAGGLADTVLTDHPAGVLRVLPLPVHLNLEAAAGLQLLLTAATWLRGEPAGGRWAVAAQGVYELVRSSAAFVPAGPARRVPVAEVPDPR